MPSAIQLDVREARKSIAIRRLERFLLSGKNPFLHEAVRHAQIAYRDSKVDQLAALRLTAIEAGYSISDLAAYDR